MRKSCQENQTTEDGSRLSYQMRKGVRNGKVSPSHTQRSIKSPSPLPFPSLPPPRPFLLPLPLPLSPECSRKKAESGLSYET